MKARESILSLLDGNKPAAPPAFSGLIHVTAQGLQSEGLIFHETHKDAHKLARAAASTFKLSGLPSAVVPLDMYVEAEALGAQINYREHGEYEFPQVSRAGFESARHLADKISVSSSILSAGRIGLVCRSIESIKKDIGGEVVIGGMIPGPYTLLLLVVEAGKMFMEMKKEPQVVTDALHLLASLLAEVGNAYRSAGADLVTIHDMGGSPAFIGPAKYEQFVLPAEKLLIEKLHGPRVLSVCGNVTGSLALLAQCGAEAVSVDQTADLAAARLALKDSLLFGNIDPVETLWQGDEDQIRASVVRATEAGVDAIWPGCDLVPLTPIGHLKTLVE